jgi:hypothetical protein
MNPCPAINSPKAARSRLAITGKSRVRHAVLSGLAVTLFFAAAAEPSFAQYALTCASEDGHRHYCSADTRAGVSLQRQRSKSACTQGQTWGFDQQGIWVDRGCRADFLVNAPQVAQSGDRDRDRFREHDEDADRDRDLGGEDGDRHDYDHGRDHEDRDHDRFREHDNDADHGRDLGGDDGDRHDYDHGRDHADRRQETMQLTCASEDGARHYCESDIQGEAVLLRQRSGSPCRQGYSWGNDRRGIWVDHGCRADFSLKGWSKPPVDSNYTPAYSGTLKCSSDFGTRQYCAVDTRGTVRISRQISESSCRLGYSWGYDSNGVWVDHGCRAEFEIGNLR